MAVVFLGPLGLTLKLECIYNASVKPLLSLKPSELSIVFINAYYFDKSPMLPPDFRSIDVRRSDFSARLLCTNNLNLSKSNTSVLYVEFRSLFISLKTTSICGMSLFIVMALIKQRLIVCLLIPLIV